MAPYSLFIFIRKGRVFIFLKKTSKVYRRFLISYVIILFIPLCAGYFTYHAAIKEAQNYAIRTSVQSLNQSKSLLEQRLSEVERFTRQIAINEDLVNIMLLNKNEATEQISSLTNVSKAITPFASTNDFIEDYYIRVSKSDLIITPGSVQFRPQHFYRASNYSEAYLQLIENGDLSRSSYISSPDGEHEFGLTFVQPIPIDHAYSPLGSVVVPIKQSNINKIVKAIPDDMNAWSYILDKQSNVISSTNIRTSDVIKWANLSNGEEVRYLEDGTLLITLRSEKNDWIYAAGIPKNTIAAQAKPIKDITFIVVTITLLVGFIMSLQFSRKNSLPITSIVQKLDDYVGREMKTKNEYDSIISHVSYLLESHSKMQHSLSKQTPVLKDLFIKQLLQGGFIQEGNHLDFSLKDQHQGRVVVVSSSSTTDLLLEKTSNRHYEQFDDQLKCQLGSLYTFFHKTHSQNKLIYLILVDKDKHLKSFYEIETFLKEMNTVISIPSIQFGIGNRFETLSNVTQSYREAILALHYAQDQSSVVTFYDEISQSPTLYFYPYDVELKLFKQIKEGHAELAFKTIETVFRKNQEEKKLSPTMFEHFMLELKGTIIRAVDSQMDDEKGKKIYTELLLLDIHAKRTNEIKDLFLSVVEHYSQWKKKNQADENHLLIKEIKQYVETHFYKSNLTSHLIATELGMQEKNMTILFKLVTGEKLIEYIEKVRIQKAEELLSQNLLTIDEIAEQVGYNSAHSFRRVFKRIHSITPMQFRDNMRP